MLCILFVGADWFLDPVGWCNVRESTLVEPTVLGKLIVFSWGRGRLPRLSQLRSGHRAYAERNGNPAHLLPGTHDVRVHFVQQGIPEAFECLSVVHRHFRALGCGVPDMGVVRFPYQPLFADRNCRPLTSPRLPAVVRLRTGQHGGYCLGSGGDWARGVRRPPSRDRGGVIRPGCVHEDVPRTTAPVVTGQEALQNCYFRGGDRRLHGDRSARAWSLDSGRGRRSGGKPVWPTFPRDTSWRIRGR